MVVGKLCYDCFIWTDVDGVLQIKLKNNIKNWLETQNINYNITFQQISQNHSRFIRKCYFEFQNIDLGTQYGFL